MSLKIDIPDLSSITSLITVAVLAVALLIVFRVSIHSLDVSRRIRNEASIQVGEGLEVDTNLVQWGVLEPSDSVNKTINVRNTSPLNEVLILESGNWTPAQAEPLLTFVWNYSGASLTPSSTIPIRFTLTLTSNVTAILNSNVTSFSFDIIISASKKP